MGCRSRLRQTGNLDRNAVFRGLLGLDADTPDNREISLSGDARGEPGTIPGTDRPAQFRALALAAGDGDAERHVSLSEGGWKFVTLLLDDAPARKLLVDQS